MARVRSPLLPQTPTVFEQAKLTADQEWQLDFRANLNDLGRILVTTPGVPEDRLQFLRGAIERVLNNPELIAEGAKTQRFVAFQPAEKALELTRKALTGVPAPQVARMRQVIFGR